VIVRRVFGGTKKKSVANMTINEVRRMKDLRDMTQFEYVRLENMVARALHTQRRLIRIDTATPLPSGNADLRVIYRSGFVYRIITDGVRVFAVAREVLKVAR